MTSHSLHRRTLWSRLDGGDGMIDRPLGHSRRAPTGSHPTLALVLFLVGYAALFAVLLAPADWLRPAVVAAARP